MRIGQRVGLALLATLATGCLLRVPANGPLDGLQCGGHAGFVWTQGADTLALERLSIQADNVLDRQILRDREVVYHARIDSALTVVNATTNVWSYEHARTGDVLESGIYELDGDTAWYGWQRGDQARLDHDGIVPHTAILVGETIGLEELMLRRARRAGRDSVDIPTFYLSLRVYAPMAHVRFIGRDSARIRFGADSVVNLRVDGKGGIIGAYYPSTSVVISRVKCGAVEDVLAERKKSVGGTRP